MIVCFVTLTSAQVLNDSSSPKARVMPTGDSLHPFEQVDLCELDEI